MLELKLIHISRMGPGNFEMSRFMYLYKQILRVGYLHQEQFD